MNAPIDPKVLGVAPPAAPWDFAQSRMGDAALAAQAVSDQATIGAALADPRTQAEVARILFDNAVPSAVVTYLGLVIVWLVYWGTVPNAALLGALLVCAGVQAALIELWRRYRAQVAARQASGDFDWSVRQLKRYAALSFALMAGMSAFAVLLAFSSIAAAPMVATVLLLVYLIGATVADFIYRPAVLIYPIISLLPMGLLHATSGVPVQWAMAAFFAFYFFAVVLYSANFSERMQLSIYQRFRIDALLREIDAQRREVQAAHDAKSRFFAAASHDVRQPLQALGVLTDALKLPQSQAEREALLHQVDANAQALRGLFDQVLEATRLRAGTIEVRATDMPLAPLMAALRARFASEADRQGVRLRLAPTRAVLRCDPRLLERMVANLMGNAIKHTPRGGTVWVGWRAARGRIEVRDSGVGIALDEQDKVFDEFYQVPSGGADALRPAVGLGLGLAIVRRFAALGGHAVGLRSAPGRGSVFWVSATAVAAAARGTEPVSAPTAAKNSIPNAKGRLVYVENDAPLLALTARLLAFGGWAVTPCTRADEALAHLRAHADCTALLTDYRLSERSDTEEALQDGAQLVRAARALPQHGALPVIVLTGDAAVPGLQGLARVQVLHKPIKSTELLAALDTLLGPQSS
jgi:two-component system, sensor histidine kinase